MTMPTHAEMYVMQVSTPPVHKLVSLHILFPQRKARLQKTKSSEKSEGGGQFENEEKGSPDGDNASDDSNKVVDENDSGGDVSKTIADCPDTRVAPSDEDNHSGGVRDPEDQTQEASTPGSMNTSTLEGSKDSLCENQVEQSKDDPSGQPVMSWSQFQEMIFVMKEKEQ